MKLRQVAQNIAMFVIGCRRSTIIGLFGAVFVAVYLPLTVLLIAADYYAHILDTLAVIAIIATAMLICALVAFVRLPDIPLDDGVRKRENRGWWLLGAGLLIILIGRLIYASAELSGGAFVHSIPAADALFGVSFLFFVTGLLAIPWSHAGRQTSHVLIDSSVVLVAVGALFWPLLLGPAALGEYQDAIDNLTLSSYMFAVFILAFTILWIVLRDIREEMWPVAIAFVLSIMSMILVQLGYLAFLASADSGNENPGPLLIVNASTSLSILLMALAGMLRLNVTTTNDADALDLGGTLESPVHFWQIVLPYVLLATLIGVWLSMEFFGWREEHSGGVAVGVGAIAVLLMIRQTPILRHNDELYRRVAESSIRDGLTGLFSHRAMHDFLRREVATHEPGNKSVAVIFLDIDFFKRYNDTYGHRQGDQLLVSVARLLANGVRSTDFVGRYGGEEFMIIAPGVTAAEAGALGERLRRMVESQRFIQNGTRSGVTISVGVALCPDDTTDPEDLIELADQAMYRAKAAGRNRMVSYAAVS